MDTSMDKLKERVETLNRLIKLEEDHKGTISLFRNGEVNKYKYSK